MVERLFDRLNARLNRWLKGNADARAPFTRREDTQPECLGAVFARPCPLCEHRP